MVFNSLTFLVFFLTIVLLHNLLFSWQIKKFNLLLASYIFYAAWNPPFVILLWISTVADWYLALWIYKENRKSRKRLFVALSLAVNLGLLGYFKYGDFVLENFIHALHLFGIDFHAAMPDIILPIGISFYTFQTLSYTLDVYRGKTMPGKSFLDYALYVTFFPQLVAGPIVRATDFLPQCLQPRKATIKQFGWGLSLLAMGLFQKVILADSLLAPIVEKVYDTQEIIGTLEAWTGTLAFSGQIFFDFSGYSTCAIGAAMCLGFALPDNFRFPYAAIGFSDFWRRWHISLSSWLRDYLYISLGGNRYGSIKTYTNIMVTMLIGGLWHGASWTFVIWGGLHGIYLVIERGMRRLFSDQAIIINFRYTRILLALFTFLCVTITWVFFRAEDLNTALSILSSMFSHTETVVYMADEIITVLLIMPGLFALHWYLRDSYIEHVAALLPWWLVSVFFTTIIIILAVNPGENRAFIYFQF